jgi:hypothetical protein
MRSSNLNLNISKFQQQSISMLSPLVIYEDIAISQCFQQLPLHKCLMSFNLGKKNTAKACILLKQLQFWDCNNGNMRCLFTLPLGYGNQGCTLCEGYKLYHGVSQISYFMWDAKFNWKLISLKWNVLVIDIFLLLKLCNFTKLKYHKH